MAPLHLLRKDLDWSTLPHELLEDIGRILPLRHEAIKFRSICPVWRVVILFAKYITPLGILSFDPEQEFGYLLNYHNYRISQSLW
jgi:hypothetical protein